MALKFSYAVLQRELEDLKNVAASFLSNTYVLEGYLDDLRHLQYKHGVVPWQIRLGQELRTRPSRSYEVDGNGIEVYGTVSGIWDIRRIDQRTFEIADKASFSASIVRAHDDQPIAGWNCDIAADNGPGAWLHSQVKWHCHNLPVPRFPALVVTLADVVDFLLGELYQREWPIAVQRRQSAAQNGRLTRLLANMLGSVQGGGPTRGLSALKASRPPAALFIAAD